MADNGHLFNVGVISSILNLQQLCSSSRCASSGVLVVDVLVGVLAVGVLVVGV